MLMLDKKVIKVAVPGPFLTGLDYLLPETSENLVGKRVWVNLGRRKVVGVVLNENIQSDFEPSKLKNILSVIDQRPLFDQNMMRLLNKVADYYQAPIGEVFYTAMPTQLCKGKECSYQKKYAIELSLNISKAKFPLNEDQKGVLEACVGSQKQFCVQLIEGVTGSGKTEIYLQLIEQALKAGKQALVLVPEIGLTPQTIERFEARFGKAVIAIHSKLNDSEKRQHWYLASTGEAKIVIGTRSAVFTPMPNLGIIVIDEEHDLSFKQQNGVKYSARDVAVMRAKMENIPIVLGSATPSLESLYNAKKGRYQHYYLPKRAGLSISPSFHLIDMRQQPMQAGLSRPLLEAIKEHLAKKSQVLLFLNRRGYAPVLMCHACSWTAQCNNCDAYYTLHQKPLHLCCHHCGSSHKIVKTCPQCHESQNLIHVGMGTEQLETALSKLFPEHKILRLDKDSTRLKGSLDEILKSVHQKEADIIVGTQMLAKGHHFEGVTMVGIIDMDNGLFSSDFRSLERAGQLLVQVAGRAGRVEEKGQVYIQTHQPEHPSLLTLLEQGYADFSRQLLAEREQALWPPFSYLALLRAEALHSTEVFAFLKQVKNFMQHSNFESLQILGPAPALMQKKARYFRGQLLLQSHDRPSLHLALKVLQNYLQEIETHKIRYSIDVDPLEMG